MSSCEPILSVEVSILIRPMKGQLAIRQERGDMHASDRDSRYSGKEGVNEAIVILGLLDAVDDGAKHESDEDIGGNARKEVRFDASQEQRSPTAWPEHVAHGRRKRRHALIAFHATGAAEVNCKIIIDYSFCKAAEVLCSRAARGRQFSDGGSTMRG